MHGTCTLRYITLRQNTRDKSNPKFPNCDCITSVLWAVAGCECVKLRDVLLSWQPALLLCVRSRETSTVQNQRLHPGAWVIVARELQLVSTKSMHFYVVLSHKNSRQFCELVFLIISRSHSYCLSLPLCLEWYNGSIIPRVHSGVTKPAQCRTV